MYTHGVKDKHFYVILGTTKDIKRVETELLEYNSKFYPGTDFLIKSIEYKDRQLIYLKTFENKDQAQAYHQEMKTNSTFLESAGMKDLSLFAISEENFKILIRLKNDDAYLAFFNKHFPFEL